MAIGYQTTQTEINVTAGALAIELRNLCARIVSFHSGIVAMGDGVDSRAAALVLLGFTDAGGAGDAHQMVRLADVINTVAQIVYGNATQPTPYNFNNDLSSLWGTR